MCVGTHSARKSFVLISTYWNVNLYNPRVDSTRVEVLISTYWNVNTGISSTGEGRTCVLISTYWNVNYLMLE